MTLAPSRMVGRWGVCAHEDSETRGVAPPGGPAAGPGQQGWVVRGSALCTGIAGAVSVGLKKDEGPGSAEHEASCRHSKGKNGLRGLGSNTRVQACSLWCLCAASVNSRLCAKLTFLPRPRSLSGPRPRPASSQNPCRSRAARVPGKSCLTAAQRDSPGDARCRQTAPAKR